MSERRINRTWSRTGRKSSQKATRIRCSLQQRERGEALGDRLSLSQFGGTLPLWTYKFKDRGMHPCTIQSGSPYARSCNRKGQQGVKVLEAIIHPHLAQYIHRCNPRFQQRALGFDSAKITA
ncbi:unnamed protein product [Victoria cruziana]